METQPVLEVHPLIIEAYIKTLVMLEFNHVFLIFCPLFIIILTSECCIIFLNAAHCITNGITQTKIGLIKDSQKMAFQF